MSSSSARLSLVPVSDIGEIWADIRPLVEAACTLNGAYSTQDVLGWLMTGKWRLFVITSPERSLEAICVTEIATYPKRTQLEIPICTGSNSKDWLHLIDGIKEYAREQGCSVIIPLARPGWRKLLAPYGFKKTHELLECPL